MRKPGEEAQQPEGVGLLRGAHPLVKKRPAHVEASRRVREVHVPEPGLIGAYERVGEGVP